MSAAVTINHPALRGLFGATTLRARLAQQRIRVDVPAGVFALASFDDRVGAEVPGGTPVAHFTITPAVGQRALPPASLAWEAPQRERARVRVR